MKTRLYTEERRNSILSLLHENKHIEVNDLCTRFSVSGATIRSDLKVLEQRGYLLRTHGGAIRNDYEKLIEDTPSDRKITNEKIIIAEETVKHIQNNESLVIDTGTSCYAFAQALLKSNLQDLSILTADLKIALLLSENSNFTVQILGGQIRNHYSYVSGSSLVEKIRNFSVDTAIIATNAFDINFGFSTPNYETAELKRNTFYIAKKAIVLCDSSKMNKRCFCSFGTIDDCQLLITDKHIKKNDLEQLKKSGTSIIVV